MFTYDTEKGELCQIECWMDEDMRNDMKMVIKI